MKPASFDLHSFYSLLKHTHRKHFNFFVSFYNEMTFYDYSLTYFLKWDEKKSKDFIDEPLSDYISRMIDEFLFLNDPNFSKQKMSQYEFSFDLDKNIYQIKKIPFSIANLCEKDTLYFRDHVKEAMKKNDLESFVFWFSGGGDSGAIDGTNMPDSFSSLSAFPEENSTITFYQLSEKIAYAMLEKTGMDWYNNEGGHGEISFHESGEIEIEINIAEINYDQHSFSY
jgi:hypothetical protein